ncbi:hypothetical protein PG999_007426 [Apiospora kogelbergensis]|uniref:Uncharacterized protein n=1 Tax=Apiospora kogelbergensis TaxID=1337665 RepID=A0AAW0QYA5_9PEZI
MASISSEHQPEAPSGIREIHPSWHIIQTVATTAVEPADPGRRSIDGQSRVLDTSSSQVAIEPKSRLARIWRAFRGFSNTWGDFFLKLITFLAFLIAAVAVWPSISSASDGHKAELIAEWTARKDFMESCEAVSAP